MLVGLQPFGQGTDAAFNEAEEAEEEGGEEVAPGRPFMILTGLSSGSNKSSPSVLPIGALETKTKRKSKPSICKNSLVDILIIKVG